MNTIRFIRELEIIRDSIGHESDFYGLLSRSKTTYYKRNFLGIKIKVKTSSSRFPKTYRNKKNSSSSKTCADLDHYNPRLVFEMINESVKIIKDCHIDFGNLISKDELLDALDELADNYSGYFKDGQDHRVIASRKLVKKNIDYYENLASFFLENLSNIETSDIQNNESRSTLYLPEQLSINEFASKISNVATLYDEICGLLGLSTTEYPLRVNRIEYGSIFFDIIGSKPVIGLIGALLTASAAWIHRKYTTEGRLEQLPKNTEAIEKMLDLQIKLKDLGVDVDHQLESIRIISLRLCNELDQLLSDQSTIEIDGVEYPITNSTEKLLAKDAVSTIEHDKVNDNEKVEY